MRPSAVRGRWIVLALAACGGGGGGSRRDDGGAPIDAGPDAEAGPDAAIEDAAPDGGPVDGDGWSRVFGTWEPGEYTEDVPRGAIATPDGGWLVFGRSDSVFDTWMLKLDAAGGLVGSTRLIYSEMFVAERAERGAYRMYGHSYTADVLHVVEVGATALSRTELESDLWDREIAGGAITAGGAILAGTGTLPDLTPVGWIAKASLDEGAIWERRFQAGTDTIAVVDAAAQGDGRAAVLGTVRAGASPAQPFVAIFGADGALVAGKRLTLDASVAVAIEATPSGWVVVGRAGAEPASDAWVVSLDADGGIVWQNVYAAGADVEGFGGTAEDVVAHADGRVTFAGAARRSELGPEGFWIVGLEADGTVRFAERHDDLGPPESLTAADDGGALATGTAANDARDLDAWVARFDADGEIDHSSCAPGADVAPTVSAGAAVASDLDLQTTEGPLSVLRVDDAYARSSTTYERTQCGAAATTPWGAGAVGTSCSCDPGLSCVGPEIGCAIGSTCVGHHVDGEAVGSCAAGCWTDEDCPDGTTCHETYLGPAGEVIDWSDEWCY